MEIGAVKYPRAPLTWIIDPALVPDCAHSLACLHAQRVYRKSVFHGGLFEPVEPTAVAAVTGAHISFSVAELDFDASACVASLPILQVPNN